MVKGLRTWAKPIDAEPHTNPVRRPSMSKYTKRENLDTPLDRIIKELSRRPDPDVWVTKKQLRRALIAIRDAIKDAETSASDPRNHNWDGAGR